MNKLLLGITASIAVAAALWVASGATPAGAAEPNPAHGAYLAEQTSLSRQVVIDRVRSLTAVVRRGDRFDAKLTTFGEYERARGVSLSSIQRIAASKQVWLVAASGDIRPGYNKPRPYTNQLATFTWAVFVIDPVTGDVLATHAESSGAWPAFFEGLLDQAP
jgi:hypothetical protein